jgi:hypothetical protein
MTDSFGELPDAQFTAEGFENYLTRELGLSPDIAILKPVDLVAAVACGLEEHHIIAASPPEKALAMQRHEELSAGQVLTGALKHLRNQTSFIDRYMQLVGTSSGGMRLPAEVTAGVVNSSLRLTQAETETARHRLALNFERFTAREYLKILEGIYNNPVSQSVGSLGSAFTLIREEEQLLLRSDGNWRPERLPLQHCGVLQLAPYIPDVIARFDELKKGSWPNIALIHNNPFNEELARAIGQQIFKMAGEDVFIDRHGIVEGMASLAYQRHTDSRWRQGFGAIIMADVHNYSADEIDEAIAQAPRLLATNGILLLRDVEQFPDREGSATRMINKARSVFKSEPISHTQLIDGPLLIAQHAVFKKTARPYRPPSTGAKH